MSKRIRVKMLCDVKIGRQLKKRQRKKNFVKIVERVSLDWLKN